MELCTVSRSASIRHQLISVTIMHGQFLGFCIDEVEICVLLGCGSASVVNWCPAFWDNLLVLSSRVRRFHHSPSTRQAPITQWCDTTFKKKKMETLELRINVNEW